MGEPMDSKLIWQSIWITILLFAWTALILAVSAK
jgi:hypothetical protein